MHGIMEKTNLRHESVSAINVKCGLGYSILLVLSLENQEIGIRKLGQTSLFGRKT